MSESTPESTPESTLGTMGETPREPGRAARESALDLLVECGPVAPAAGAVARALHDALGVAADDVLTLTPAREGVVARVRAAEHLARGPLRLRVRTRGGTIPVRARRLDQPEWPGGTTWALRLTPRTEVEPPAPGAFARALSIAAEDVGAIARWAGGVEIRVHRSRLRPGDVPQTVTVDGNPWDVVPEARATRSIDAVVDRYLRAQGADGEAALVEALTRALDGLPLTDLPSALALAAKKKSLTTP